MSWVMIGLLDLRSMTFGQESDTSRLQIEFYWLCIGEPRKAPGILRFYKTEASFNFRPNVR